MSSSLVAETPAFGTRAKMVLTVFAGLGIGAICSSLVFIILLAGFKDLIQEDIKNLEWVWRLLMGVGMCSYMDIHMFGLTVANGMTLTGLIPCALTCYSRLVMKETKPYEKCKLLSDSAYAFSLSNVSQTC
ncbi:hypothetical protein IMZ48_36405 [Candidatus Bathyarchaeota archaeon]|nr:hypothetical protein [Candidatus Bathyarchaeota archaeon]